MQRHADGPLATLPPARPLRPPEILGRILVVDDTEANRELLLRRLRRQGHAVEWADNGRAALERLAAEPFDLVLLDVMMPEMNGYETLERLKADPALRHIPVIMITAIEEPDSIIHCIELGAEDHLPKPFNATLLRARIDSSLAKKRLRDREQVYARSLERELEIARNIQRSFLPDRLPLVDGWELASCFRPARQVAGDFYDAFALPVPDRLLLVIADVCGKGVGAAVFMAAFRSLLRALTGHAYAPGEDDGAQLVRTVRFLNDYVAVTHSRENMFTTLWAGALDAATGRLAWVNAGHDAPALLRRSGAVERLGPTGPAVGLLPGMPFASAETTLDAGDLLLAFTDGSIDARDPSGASYGEARLLAHLAPAPPTAAALVEGIERDVVARIGAAEQFDDVTLLAVRRTVARGGAPGGPP